MAQSESTVCAVLQLCRSGPFVLMQGFRIDARFLSKKWLLAALLPDLLSVVGSIDIFSIVYDLVRSLATVIFA